LKGYLALGSNGENKSLNENEKEKVLKTIVNKKNENQIIMAGCIYESTKHTVEFAKIAENLGADIITLLPPSYFKKYMTDEVLIKYFTMVADSVNIPCMVYNAPQFCGGILFSVNLVKELAKHPNIIGMKDSSKGNIEKYLLEVGDKFNIMAGSANFFMNALLMGAPGGVVSLADAFPNVINELYELTINKKYDEAFKLNKKILILNKTVSGSGGVAAVKVAMDLTGLNGGLPRLPLIPLNNVIQERIKETLKESGLI